MSLWESRSLWALGTARPGRLLVSSTADAIMQGGLGPAQTAVRKTQDSSAHPDQPVTAPVLGCRVPPGGGGESWAPSTRGSRHSKGGHVRMEDRESGLGTLVRGTSRESSSGQVGPRAWSSPLDTDVEVISVNENPRGWMRKPGQRQDPGHPKLTGQVDKDRGAIPPVGWCAERHRVAWARS